VIVDSAVGPAASVQIGDSPLARFFAARSGAKRAIVERAQLLGGGAIQQNWLVDVRLDDRLAELVLRTDGQSTLTMSHSRAQEFALLSVARAAGVTVAEPLWLCTDPVVIGAPFFVMKRVAGTAVASRVVRDARLGGERATLAERLGAQLARIHGIRPAQPQLAFLPLPKTSPALDAVASNRTLLDTLEVAPRPVLEWGLRWLERHAPARSEIVLCHRDFRTGNYMLDGDSITAILDWEFAGWGDAADDLGWFCATCWRFGATALEAGGIGAREDFYRGYERASGTPVDPAAVKYWEVAAHVRWGIIALLQANRHLSGAEESLELALTSHIVPELEYEILELTGGER
jgi:aminoglycoside phosphotransferase (APT) family kinase protein